MNINRLLKYLLGISLFLLVCACQHDTVYYTYHPIPNKGWSRGDTLRFSLPDTLTPGTYNLEVGVRHSNKYPYRDLWLELIQYIPGEKSSDSWVAKKDTIHLYLANEKGNWKGTGTTGGHFQLISHSGSLTIYNDSPKKLMEETKEDMTEEEDVESVQVGRKEKSLKDDNSANITKKGNRKKYTFLGKQHKLGKDAKHHLDVIHIMTDTTLLQLSDIGLRLSTQHP